jgi:hypothetical protein
MNPFQKSISLIGGMSLVKKTLIVFFCLLFFVLVVEGPGGSDSGGRGGQRLLFPKLLAFQVAKVELGNLPGPTPLLNLSKADGLWKVVNGHSFPADTDRVDRFLSIFENMSSGQVVSNNPTRFPFTAWTKKPPPMSGSGMVAIGLWPTFWSGKPIRTDANSSKRPDPPL